jgi:hypothetical protein
LSAVEHARSVCAPAKRRIVLEPDEQTSGHLGLREAHNVFLVATEDQCKCAADPGDDEHEDGDHPQHRE